MSEPDPSGFPRARDGEPQTHPGGQNGGDGDLGMVLLRGRGEMPPLDVEQGAIKSANQVLVSQATRELIL